MTDAERRFATTMREADKAEPGLIQEDDGTVWLVKPDGTRSELGAAGAGSTGAAYYSGGNVLVPNGGGQVLLDWEIHDAGDVLLNVSDPQHPTVLEAGIYLICAQVESNVLLTEGGFLELDLILDYGGDNAEMVARSPAQGADGRQTRAFVSAAYRLPAGGEFRLYVANFDGASDRDFSLKNATVTKVG